MEKQKEMKIFWNWVEWIERDKPIKFWKVFVSFLAVFLALIVFVNLIKWIF